MKTYHSLLVLSITFWGSADSMPQFIQDKNIRIVTTGEQVTLKCSMHEGRMAQYWMFLYKEESNGSFLLVYREGNVYGPGFQEGFVGNIEANNNLFTLRLRSSHKKDSGIYYCAASSDAPCSKLVELDTTIYSNILPALQNGIKINAFSGHFR
uniref:Ig-like domain-containing protein n=1 Tax=Leptobrachium leishanense TaxID=445787 RepID=A0A8C5M809_9ANUR